jgi:hypothetical protein
MSTHNNFYPPDTPALEKQAPTATTAIALYQPAYHNSKYLILWYSEIRRDAANKPCPVHAMKEQRRFRGMDPLIFNLYTRWSWVVNKTLVSTEYEPGWAPEPVSTPQRRGKFLVPAWIRTPNSRARSLVTILTELLRFQGSVWVTKQWPCVL